MLMSHSITRSCFAINQDITEMCLPWPTRLECELNAPFVKFTKWVAVVLGAFPLSKNVTSQTA